MVEWKPLNKIVKSISTGLNPRQNFILNEKDASLYYVTVKEITTNKVVFSDSTDRITENAKQIINIRSKLSKGDILFSGIGTIGKVAYVDIPTSNWDCSESVFLIKPNELETKGKYLAYILSSDIAKNQYERGAAGAIMKGVRKVTLESLLIPIPSLEEQTRIVGILDTFTSAIDNLKEQIAQRRKQYEYYRDQLLDLEGKPGVEMKTLGEVCEIKGRIGFRGYTREDQVEEGEGVISLSPGNIENGQMVYKGCTYITWEKYEESPEIKTYDGDILFCKTGSTVGKVAMVKELPCEATINPQLVVLKNITIDSKFLNYILGTYTIQSTVKRLAGVGSVPNISQEKLGNLTIPLPPLQEQQRIVSILDTFEASIQNLEAQLKEREKQYEYYRNKLLTFE